MFSINMSRKRGRAKAVGEQSMFNPLVSRVNLRRDGPPLEQGSKAIANLTDKQRQDDDLLPPLNDSHMSLCSNFEIISGIPAYVFDVHNANHPGHDTVCFTPNPRVASIGQKSELNQSLVLALLSNGVRKGEKKDRIFPNFKTAAAAAAFAAMISKGSEYKPRTTRSLRGPSLPSPSVRREKWQRKKIGMSMSLPGTGDPFVSPHEALQHNFFSTGDLPSCILCSSFSCDGKLMVSGHANGSVKVWDAHNGLLQDNFQCPHKCAVACVAFRGLSSRKIISCDISGSVVITDISQNRHHRQNSKRHILTVEGAEDEVLIMAPEISQDGKWIVVKALHTACDLYQKLSLIRGGKENMPRLPKYSHCILTAWDLTDYPDPTPITFKYDTQMEDHNLQIRTLQFTAQSKGFLITTVDDYRDCQGSTKFDNRVVIWPDITDPTNFVCADGGYAAWSCKNLVATWDPAAKDLNCKGTCMVWDLRAYESQPLNDELDERVPNMNGLQDSSKDTVHWCEFINCPGHPQIRLVASLSQEKIRIVVWDVIGSTKVHVLETGLDVSPHVLSSTNQGDWLCLFAPERNLGIMWNMEYGVQVLHLTLPKKLIDEKSPFSLCFAPNGSRMATISPNRIVVWNVGTLMPQSNSGTPFLMRDSFGDNVQMRECKISYTGDCVAVLLYLTESNFNRIHVWNVRQRMEWVLPSAHSTSLSEHAISAFALSQLGEYLAACFETGGVVVWDLRSDDTVQGVHYTRISTEGSIDNQHRCMDCCFVPKSRPSSQHTIVVCTSDGYIHWLGMDQKEESSNGGERSWLVDCKFSECGCFASLLRNDMRTVTHWDLVNRCIVRNLKFETQLRQMNKPAIGSDWPMAISPTGDFAIAGMEKESWKPLKCLPGSSSFELRARTGKIPNVAAFSQCCRCVIVGDMSDMYDAEDSERKDASLIWVLDIEGKMAPKVLRGAGGIPRSIAISGDGRTVACVTIGSTLAIWTAYGVDGCIPDFDRVMHMTRMEGIQENSVAECEFMMGLLAKYGPSIINYPDYFASSILLHTVKGKKMGLLKTLLDWATTKNVKICLHTSKDFINSNDDSNAIQLAVNLRQPHIVQALINAALMGNLTGLELESTFKESLLCLAIVYPSIFYSTIADDRFLRVLGELQVAESAFEGESKNFMAATSNGKNPPCNALESFWRNMKPAKLQKPGSICVSAIAKVIPYPDIARAGFGGLMRELLLSMAPVQVFSTLPLRATITYKWETYAQKLLLKELLLYIIVLLLFTMYCILKGYSKSPMYLSWRGGGILIATTLMSLWKLYRVSRQFWMHCRECRVGYLKPVLYWAGSGMKWLEVISLVMLAIVTPLMHLSTHANDGHNADQEVRLRQFVAVLSILLWWVLLYYAQPFKHTGPLVIIIQEILKDMRFFLVLATSILFGFGVAFFVLFNTTHGDHEVPVEFTSLDRSIITTFGMMLGEFDTNLFYQTSHPFVSLTLFVGYMIAMMVILLNLLIAIMGDTFDKVTHTKEMQFLKAKAKVIDDIETLISRSDREKLQKLVHRHLHVLVPNYLEGHRLKKFEWKGRTLEMQKNMRELLMEGLDNLDHKITHLATEYESRAQAFSDSYTKIEEQLSEIKQDHHQMFQLIKRSHSQI